MDNRRRSQHTSRRVWLARLLQRQRIISHPHSRYISQHRVSQVQRSRNQRTDNHLRSQHTNPHTARLARPDQNHHHQHMPSYIRTTIFATKVSAIFERFQCRVFGTDLRSVFTADLSTTFKCGKPSFIRTDLRTTVFTTNLSALLECGKPGFFRTGVWTTVIKRS